MVNQLQHMRKRVVKAEMSEGFPAVTAKGGLVLAQKVAQKTRLWSDVQRLLPGRRDPSQGFPTEAAVCAFVHGLLAGGRGFRAAEALREDAPLLKMLGLSAAPSPETTERVVKYVAQSQDDAVGPNALLRSQARRILREMPRRELLDCHGFFTLWGDGTLLEVEGSNFDSLKTIQGQTGQVCGGVFAGPVAAGLRFAEGQRGEKTVVMDLLEQAFQEVVRPLRLARRTLVLLDSLYGNGPTFDALETLKSNFIVGVNNLERAQQVMAEIPEWCWQDTGARARLNWDASGVAVAYLQCDEWSQKRVMVCRRFRRRGEMVWNYRAVVTNLDESDRRVAGLMAEKRWSFAQAIWRLYGHKQALENYWKELLCDMGLHHPPCARARVNSVFHALAAVAWNLSVAVRRLTLRGAEKTMRLWRLRRDYFDLAALALHHGRTVLMRFIDARRETTAQLLLAMDRL